MHATTPPLIEPVMPPTAFGIVEPGIYRCNAFNADHFSFINRIPLKSIIYLSSELTRLKEFVDQTSIKFCHQGLKAWRPELTWKPVSDELVKDSLEFILNLENHRTCIGFNHNMGIIMLIP
jgi:hypothetical protein